jgi:putative peptidoglycan lipid II flippase
MASYSLRAYALGLVPFMLIKVLAPGFYARKDMKTPVKIGVTAMVANMVMNVLFVLPLLHFYNVGHMGLALATSCSALLNATLLLRGLLREQVYRFTDRWSAFLLRLVLATLAMSAVLVLILPAPDLWFAWGPLQRALGIALVCAAGAMVYAIAHLVSGTRLSDLRAPAHRGN